LVAVVDTNPNVLDQLELPAGVRVFTSIAAALDGSVEAAIIATPSSTHALVALEAISAGVAVLVEKPLATRKVDAQAVLTAAQGGPVVVTGHLMAFHPAVAWLETMVWSGRIGRVRSITTRRISRGAAATTEPALWALGPHDVSLALRLSGELATGVRAESQDRGRSMSQAVDVFFDLGPEIQTRIHLSRRGPAPVRLTEVVGTEGTIRIDELSGEGWLKRQGSELEFHAFDSAGVLEAQCRAFAASVRSGARSMGSLTQAVSVVEILETAGVDLDTRRAAV